MDFFEYQERKHCNSYPLTVFHKPREPKEFMPHPNDVVEIDPILVTESHLTDSQALAWKLAHGFHP